MSDGPVKLAPPGAPPLDDIILGDDDQTLAIPGRASSPAPNDRGAKESDALAKAIEGGGVPDDRGSQRPRERSSNRVKAAEPVKETRKRSKMTLRIPDDEVSRPQLPDSRTPMGGIPALGATRPPSDPDLEPLRPNRIISVNPPPPRERTPEDTLELPRSDLEQRGHGMADRSQHERRRAPGIDAEQEAGWTPYQPTVADRKDFGGDRVMARGDDAAAAAARSALMRDPQRTMIDEPGMGAMAMMRQHDSVPPLSEDIPIDTDDDEMTRDPYEDAVTNPRLPAALDSEEIKLDEGERHTDPGDVPEVDADDLVSVESIPTPHSPHAPPPLKGGRTTPSAPPVTATSLMGQVGMTSGTPLVMPAPLAMPPGLVGPSPFGPLGVTPIAPAVAARAPSVPSPAPSAPAPISHQQHAQAPQPHRDGPRLELQLPDGQTPAAGTPMARRQQPAGGPFGFMPSVGALAPPPMNESAANRKKTRPWWEDLFNDDFIRTMAKITDGDIAREANFIEESLGCEAGATILDLACGTGRHAVELAGRGYQVVGFDLSLAMLARASDEAQDRKQKINFVQGDMREMTFEETFDGVFSWNTSFGYFEDEKNAAVIAKVHRALKKGGQFLLDVVNRDCVIRQAPSLAWFEGDGCICMDEMQIDFITSRMKVKRTLMMDDGRTKEIEYSIRVYSLHELGKMLHDNGFRVAEVSGQTGTPGVFFGCEAPRTLILAEKR
jgi:SAM-dependent methyltransferase